MVIKEDMQEVVKPPPTEEGEETNADAEPAEPEMERIDSKGLVPRPERILVDDG